MRLPDPAARRFLIPAALALVATFMPWGSVSTSLTNVGEFFPGGTFTADAFSSSMTLGIVKLPNWTPALVAGLLALAAWLGTVRPVWTVAAVVYGLVHVALVARWFLVSGGTVSLGILLTLGAYLALAATLRKPRARLVPIPHPFGI